MSHAPPAATGESTTTVGRSRAWGLCWLLFAATAMNYMDRQAVAVVGKPLMAEFGGRFEDLGWVIAAFGIAYAAFQVPAGYLADRLDVRWTYAGAVVWWSLAAIAVALAPTLGLLMAARALLGVGESFNWPCALRVTASVLPPADRGLGNGIFNSGAAVGAVITPLVVAWMADRYGWRPAFAAIGALGFVWVAAWLLATGGPVRGALKPRREAERAPSASGPSPVLLGTIAVLVAIAVAGALTGWFWTERVEGVETQPYRLSGIWLATAWLMVGGLLMALVLPMRILESAGWARDLGSIVRLRRFWVLVVVSTTVNVCWHFLVNWLPTYLQTDRGMEFVKGSMLSALPFLAADVGNLGGGALSGWLAKGGRRPALARALVMTGCVALIAPGALVGSVRDDKLVLALLAIMALGTAAFMANYFAFCQEVDARHTGLIVGILGGLGNLFAAGFAPVVGVVKDRTGSFGAVFLVVGLLPFIGLAALWLGWGRDRADAETGPTPA